jgi:hypothetical protein
MIKLAIAGCFAIMSMYAAPIQSDKELQRAIV